MSEKDSGGPAFASSVSVEVEPGGFVRLNIGALRVYVGTEVMRHEKAEAIAENIRKALSAPSVIKPQPSVEEMADALYGEHAHQWGLRTDESFARMPYWLALARAAIGGAS